MTTTDSPDPRPIADTRCDDCGAGPDTNPAGDPHGWACELVPANMFREYVIAPAADQLRARRDGCAR